ncbi:MAG: transmembrane 220 family protein [Propylenella sp.]
MRYVFAVLAVLMLLAAAVQYNDPDGPLWMAYYGVPAVWCGLAVFRSDILASSRGRALLAISLVAAVGLTIWYWPPVSDFWRESVWRMGMTDVEAARIAEQSREGMGMMIATAVVLIVAAWAFYAPRLRSR